MHTYGEYWLATNGTITAKCRELVGQIAAAAGAASHHVVTRKELDPFLRKAANQDVLLRFFPEMNSLVHLPGRVQRCTNGEFGDATDRIRELLKRKVSGWEDGQRFHLRDLEYDDRDMIGNSDFGVAWKKEFHSVDDRGLNVFIAPYEYVTIPFENIVMWNPDEFEETTTHRNHFWIVKPEGIGRLLFRG